MNLYAYAANSPTNLIDPSGLDYTTYKSVMGPWLYVNASITMYGPGASPELAAQWQQAITEIWDINPGFGKCKVKFNVQVISDPKATGWQDAASDSNFPGANNFIYVPAGSPTDLGNPHIDLTRPWSFSTGTIPSGALSGTVAHEFGHLLHLFDSFRWGHNLNPWRPRNDIMNEVNVISQHDINQIVGRVVVASETVGKLWIPWDDRSKKLACCFVIRRVLVNVLRMLQQDNSGPQKS